MKNILQIPRKELDLFSEQDLDFVYHQEKLKDFIGLPFSLENTLLMREYPLFSF